MASAPKKTIGDVAAFFFGGLAVLLSAIDFFLFFVDAIPFVGIPISVILSEFINFLALLLIYFPLYLMGAYKGKNGAANAMMTMAGGAVGFVPIINNLPVIAGGVLFVIIRSRINDKLEEKERAAKAAKLAKHEEGRGGREVRARAAAQRAEANRNSAMQASLQAANDNSQSQLSRAA